MTEWGNMTEWLVAGGALGFSLVSVWLVHRLVMQHVHTGSSLNKTILSMEVVALGTLLSSFVLGEVIKIMGVLTDRSHAAHEVGLNVRDALLVLGCLFASLLIYTVIAKFQQK